MRIMLVSLACVFIFSTDMFGQTEPVPRNKPVMVYMDAIEAAVLFGGFVNGKRQNDTWIWDGQWKRIDSKDSPPPRSGHSLAYDSNRKRVVLFGGRGENGLLNDTWEFDGQTWSKLDFPGPTPRQSHRLVYSEYLGQHILFGGSNEEGNSLEDTWILDKYGWTKLSTTIPQGRLQHGMVFNKSTKTVILHGGFSRRNGEKTQHGDTWEFNGISWYLKNRYGPSARDHHGMAYDVKNESVVVFGGYNKDYLSDTWILEGDTWKKITQNPNMARAGKPALFFDSQRQATFLFGGWGLQNKPLMDFWIWNGESWSKVD